MFCLVHTPPVKDQVLIYTPESREAIVREYIAQGKYVCTHTQTWNLNVPDVCILQMQLSTNWATNATHTSI